MADTSVDEITVPDIVQDPDEEEIIDKVSEDGEIDVDGVHYAADDEISKEPFVVENIITVMIGDPLSLEADAYMNLCMGNVHSGNDHFLQVHERAGEDLKIACHAFRGAHPGTARISPAYGLTNFKHLIHTLLPLVDDKFVGLAPYQTFSSILAALDLAAENDVKTLVVPPGIAIEPNIFGYMMLLAMKKWLTDNPDVLESVTIVCDNETDFFAFHQQLPAIEGPLDFDTPEFDKFFSAVQYTSQDFAGQPTYVDADGYELGQGAYYQDEAGQYDLEEGQEVNRKVDIHDHSLLYETDHFEQRTLLRTVQTSAEDTRIIYDIYNKMFHVADGGIKLQLSRNLSPTMLAIEEHDGRIRQYRLTTQSRNGEAYYFRCSHCEFLSKKTETQYRPKMTVRDGTIIGGTHPMHHPECIPLSKKQVLIQQIDRQVRAQIMNQNMLMREMYEKDVAEEQLAEPAALAEPKAPRIKFPSWEQVRKQYYRLKAKGEKLAAAERGKEPVNFVDAVPIMVHQDERSVNVDVIQRADRQIDSEAYGITNHEEDEDALHDEYPPVYTTYPSTSEMEEQVTSEIDGETTYYAETTINGRNISRLTAIVVKQETIQMKETDNSSREILGMPSIVSQISNARRSKRAKQVPVSETSSLENLDSSTKKALISRPRAAIMQKSRKRQASPSNGAVAEEPAPKIARSDSVSTVAETDDDAANEDVASRRRSTRRCSGRLNPRFLD